MMTDGCKEHLALIEVKGGEGMTFATNISLLWSSMPLPLSLS